LKIIYLSILLVFLLPWTSLVAQQAPAEFLTYRTTITVNKGIRTTNHFFEIQINKREGESNGGIAIPFSEGEKIYALEGGIRDKRGELVRKLKNKDIEEVSDVSDISIYEDQYVKRFNLRHNEYPYTLFYSYTSIHAEFLYITEWTPVVNYRVPVRSAVLSVELPPDYPVNIHSSLPVSPQKEITENGNVRYIWRGEFEGSLDAETLAPPRSSLLPKVIILPHQFDYGLTGSQESWAGYGAWQARLNEGLGNLPVSEKLKVEELTRHLSTVEEKVRTLYHYMQDNTRYINVSIDIGGLKPYPAEYVATNKYGDCKALTNYMKSLLAHVGIPSYYVKIFAGENPKRLITELPGQQFNHVILAVPLAHDTLWLENTSNINPFGYLGTFTQNRLALLVDGEQSRLIRTPALNLNEVQEIRTYHYSIGDDLSGHLMFNGLFKGDEFEQLNYVQHNFNPDDKDLIMKRFGQGVTFDDWHLNKHDRDDQVITLSGNMSIAKIGVRYGNNQVIRQPELILPKLDKPHDRKFPIRINFPVNKQDSVIFTLSPSMLAKNNLSDTLLTSRFGSYQIASRTESNRLFFMRKYVLFAGDYTLDDYNDFYAFHQAIAVLENKNLIILSDVNIQK